MCVYVLTIAEIKCISNSSTTHDTLFRCTVCSIKRHRRVSQSAKSRSVLPIPSLACPIVYPDWNDTLNTVCILVCTYVNGVMLLLYVVRIKA